ncbi:MAG: hypothetical protein AAF564_14800 [Bacteroidota bacterium]
MARYFPLVLFAAMMVGCELLGTDNTLVFKTDRDEYNPGQIVVVEVGNRLASPVGLNLCFTYLSLERQTDDGWEPTSAYGGERPNTVCTAIQLAVRPGNSSTGTFHLPDNQGNGTYRITTRFEINNESVWANTNSFDIR